MTEDEKALRMQRLGLELLHQAIPRVVDQCAQVQTDAATGVTVMIVGPNVPDGGLECLRQHLHARRLRQQREVVH